MRFCFTFHGRRICWNIPDLIIPFPPTGPNPPDPGPEGFLRDLMIVSTINQAIAQIADPAARHSLQNGMSSSIKGLQAKIGEDFTISLEAHAK
jgi:hypothetical protein